MPRSYPPQALSGAADSGVPSGAGLNGHNPEARLNGVTFVGLFCGGGNPPGPSLLGSAEGRVNRIALRTARPSTHPLAGDQKSCQLRSPCHLRIHPAHASRCCAIAAIW